MNDLITLLDRAAGPVAQTGTVDVDADLARGRRALSRTRRRRGAAALLCVAATSVLALGAVRYAGSDDPAQRAVEGNDSATTSGVVLLDQPMQAGPYTFDATPDGWEVQGASPFAVTIAPVGAADQDPNSFLGKLVILFDQNPPSGEQEVREGRTFWIRGDSGYTTMSTRTRPGEPTGVVSIQFPDDTGWSRDSMLEFLAGVHVGEGAQPGVG